MVDFNGIQEQWKKAREINVKCTTLTPPILGYAGHPAYTQKV